jgi:CRISPR-associated protein Csm4
METYRVRLCLHSAVLSPWQADTLFGHLCWTKRYREGEDALADFLEPFKSGDPPFLLSNGFPGCLLPRPMPWPGDAPPAGTPVAEQREQMRGAKGQRRVRYVTLEDFNRIRRGEEITAGLGAEDTATRIKTRTVLKNQINRLTGTTSGPGEEEGEAGGNLFNLHETFFFTEGGAGTTGGEISVYVQIRHPGWTDRVRTLFKQTAEAGFGANKSTGYGKFTVEAFESFAFQEIEGANGFVTLSNFVPRADDPTDGYYQLLLKYGKLGEEYAKLEDKSPFKFPLILFEAGAVFHSNGQQPPYGRLVEGIHPQDEEIVQYGYALDVPVRVPMGE